MKRTLFVLLAAFAFVALDARVARADSDGYFCIGNGYIAYQFSFTSPPVGPHRLYVVRFGAEGISEPTLINLAQFQVHGMRCRADAVDVASFNDVYSITFNSVGAPTGLQSVALASQGALPAWANGTLNLGLWSRAHGSLGTDRHSLMSQPDGSAFLLEVRASPDSIRECPHRMSARIVQVRPDSTEIRSRTLVSDVGRTDCARTSFAPVYTGAIGRGTPEDALLDALVFGLSGRINVSVYPDALRAEFANFLLRADSYRSTRPPLGGFELQMVDRAWVRFETIFFAAARADVTTSQVVTLIEALKPCYETEGFHECPVKDAMFADSVLVATPSSPFADYLPLYAAHRWLCAAEAYENEQKPADVARSMRLYRERLEVAVASRVLLFRTAAERLRERGICYLRG